MQTSDATKEIIQEYLWDLVAELLQAKDLNSKRSTLCELTYKLVYILVLEA